MNFHFFISFLCAIVISVTSASKILVVSPLPSKSHFNFCFAVAEALMKAGHDVTFITTHHEKPPEGNGTFRYILVPSCLSKMNKNLNYFDAEKMPFYMNLMMVNMLGEVCSKNAFESDSVKEFLKSKEKFDVVIMESLFTDSLAAFACHFNAPLVVLSPLGSVQWVNDVIGNPTPPSYLPSLFLEMTENMNFWERSKNYLMSNIVSLSHKFLTYPNHDKLVKEHFPNCPSVQEMNKDVALVLANSHESINAASPRVPNIIDIGGIHLKPSSEKLPADLQKILDNAKDGAIYFSLGSHVKASQMPLHMKQALVNVLGSLKQTILWKWDDDNFGKEAPKNVVVRKWFPQQEILAHPNTKLFITHCGLFSLTETIHMGVPILAMPVVGDQKWNSFKAESFGIGKRLYFSQLTEASLSSVLNELLTNPKYSENVKYRSKIYRDRHTHPSDIAVYWIEYVIRHKGAPHLRVLGKELPWYQYYCVDVVVFWSVIILSPFFLIYKLIKRMCCGSQKKSKVKKS